MTQGPVRSTDQTAIRKTVASHSYQRSVYQVHQEFDQLHPQQISDACTGWKAAADELLALAEDLKARIAVPLDDAWSSPASPGVQQQLRQAEATARALANDCLQMAHATDYAARYAQWYKDNLPSYTDSLASAAKGAVTGQGLTAGAEAATQYLVNLLSRYNEVIQTLPSAVQAPVVQPSSVLEDDLVLLPPAEDGAGSSLVPPGGGSFPSAGGPGNGSSSQGSVSEGSQAGGPSGSGASASTGVHSSGALDPYAAGSSLAGTGLGGGLSGFDPSAFGAVGGGAVGGSGLGAGLRAGALGAAGLAAGSRASGLGTGHPGSGSGSGSPGGAGTFRGPGMGGAGAGLSGQQAAAAGAGRSGVMPMHAAGGQGEGEQERERSTWLTEDEDVWQPGGDAPPPVITG